MNPPFLNCHHLVNYQQSNLFTAWLPIIISGLAFFFSLFSLFINLRYQFLNAINSKLSELARECDHDIDYEGLEGKKGTHSLHETPQHISHVVSTIISAKQFLEKNIKRNPILGIKKEEQHCIDKFYFQLHTSIRDFIMKTERHTTFLKTDTDLNGAYHRMKQIKLCRNWLKKSDDEFGNATPKQMGIEIENFKKNPSVEQKTEELNRLTSS